MVRRVPATLADVPDCLTVEELGQFLRIGRNQAYDFVRSGGIRSVHIGKRIVIPKTALMRLLEGAVEG